MRRPLLGLAALFALGSLLADRQAGPLEALLQCALCAVLLGIALAAGEGRRAMAALGAAAFAAGTASAVAESLRFETGGLRHLARGVDGDPAAVRLHGIVRGDAAERAGRLVFALDVEAVETSGRRVPSAGRARLTGGGAGPWPRLLDGERVAVWASLRAPAGTDAVLRGIGAYGYCKSVRLLERRGEGSTLLRRAAARARERARSVFADALPPGTERGLVKAMVLGDRSEIDESTAEAFRASGTYHVLALSGAQVALVAGLLVVALRRLGRAPGPPPRSRRPPSASTPCSWGRRPGGACGPDGVGGARGSGAGARRRRQRTCSASPPSSCWRSGRRPPGTWASISRSGRRSRSSP
jgi:competence protein ComEC